ncbi:restriction endonuclease subunit S [Melghirimyces algeriensis]|uniref:Type I restriction enzyme, S subunit n=1 Tax=Melghirimyces algeriensis TaxID=910412 RepID=A0A521BCT9_9BACL|nr:restriction endonuclease subunit S [Melghirimyces algeriensis]SMO44888.1 type I restriction enzyme, S subunit [Melghirimyces algeriensis]
MSRKKKQKKTLEELLQEALVPKEEQPYEVPENWVWVRLGSVVEALRGVTYKKNQVTNSGEENVCLVLRGGNIQDGKIFKFEDDVYVPFDLIKENQCLQKGDIIIVTSTGSKKVIGKSAQCLSDEANVSFGAFLTLIRPKNQNNRRYFGYYFQSDLYKKSVATISKGVNINNLKATELMNFPFPLPPLPEQKRIVNRVESLLGKIEEAKRLIEEARESFEQRRAAILARAFRGELTRTWRDQNPDVEPADRLLERIREERAQLETSKRKRKKNTDLPPIDPPYELPEGWKWVRISELFNVAGGGTPSKSNVKYWDGNIPWVSPKDMKFRVIRDTIDTITEDGLNNTTSDKYETGAIVMVVRSGILNRTLPVAILGQASAINQDMKVFNSGDSYLNEYFYWYIKGHEEFLLGKYTKSGTTVKSFQTRLFLENHYLPLPPYKEMKMILEKVQLLIETEEKVQSDLEFDNHIFTQSMLSRAFRGELGTNDHAEESALEFLKQTLAEQHGLSYDCSQDAMLQVAEQGTLYET